MLRQRFVRLEIKKRDLSKLSPQSGLSAQHARGWRGGDILAKAGAPMLFGIRAVSVGRHRQPSAPFSISASRIGSYSRFTALPILLRYACVFLRNSTQSFIPDRLNLDKSSWFRDQARPLAPAATSVSELRTGPWRRRDCPCLREPSSLRSECLLEMDLHEESAGPVVGIGTTPPASRPPPPAIPISEDTVPGNNFVAHLPRVRNFPAQNRLCRSR